MSFACVATLGPSSFQLAGRLREAGASAFRLNAAHMRLADIEQAIRTVRSDAGEIPLVLDIQGAKMRIGAVRPRTIGPGSEVIFVLAAQRHEHVPVPHPQLFSQVRRGDTLSADDGRLQFEVTEATPDTILTRSLKGGVLRPRKGINVAEHPIVLSDLNPDDQQVCLLAQFFPAVSCAVSFVTDGREAEWVRRRLPGRKVIGKIERGEAISKLAAISEKFDALWVCRGDLGSQLGSAAMARFVGRFNPRSVAKPVLMAGQVLEHLTRHSEPTRSEVCHLHDLLGRGYSGIVLSDETAIGKQPVLAVRTATSLIREFREGEE
jgi:pyruvate kinase